MNYHDFYLTLFSPTYKSRYRGTALSKPCPTPAYPSSPAYMYPGCRAYEQNYSAEPLYTRLLRVTKSSRLDEASLPVTFLLDSSHIGETPSIPWRALTGSMQLVVAVPGIEATS